jgi:hypothetical protein
MSLKPEAIRSIDPLSPQIFWAAGFWDGEGCATFHLNRSKAPQMRYPQLTIGQVDPEVLVRFQAAVGGLGKVVGPYPYREERKRNWKPRYYWRANAREARRIMPLLYPLVGTAKREQFDRVFGQGQGEQL